MGVSVSFLKVVYFNGRLLLFGYKYEFFMTLFFLSSQKCFIWDLIFLYSF